MVVVNKMIVSVSVAGVVTAELSLLISEGTSSAVALSLDTSMASVIMLLDSGTAKLIMTSSPLSTSL